MAQMEYKDAGARATEPELDEALARAIRLLISDAIASGAAPLPLAVVLGLYVLLLIFTSSRDRWPR